MSGTLNFIAYLLSTGRNLRKLHQDRAALGYLTRLAALHDLPADVAEEAQALLADIHLKQRRYRRARRHLSIALLYRPESARYHYLMATSLERGRHRDEKRAAAHYQKALQFDAEQPRCLASFGLLCLRLGRTEEGLGALTRAVDLAPNDPRIVARLVKGLCRARRPREALSVLRAARFRNPRDGRFRRLYNDFLFRRLRQKQAASRRSAEAPLDSVRACLPFVRPDAAMALPQNLRQDEAEPLPGPHRRRPQRRSDWKHG
jgi:tetratricopeptide (TPR) repeat protein